MSHEAILKAEVLSMSAVNKYSYQVKAGTQYLTGPNVIKNFLFVIYEFS
jgi:hypothetical protein